MAGNKIGTDSSGESLLGNLGVGIAIGGGSSLNLVVDNVVSGNGADGVDLFGSGTSCNVLTGNLVGVGVLTGSLPWETPTKASRSSTARHATRLAARFSAREMCFPVTAPMG